MITLTTQILGGWNTLATPTSKCAGFNPRGVYAHASFESAHGHHPCKFSGLKALSFTAAPKFGVTPPPAVKNRSAAVDRVEAPHRRQFRLTSFNPALFMNMILSATTGVEMTELALQL
jgi:hypothetical protein